MKLFEQVCQSEELFNQLFFGQWIGQPTMSSPLFSRKKIILRDTLQAQQVFNLVRLFDIGEKETFLGLTISGLARTIEVSRKFLAGAGNLSPVTSGNSRQLLRAENFA